MKDRDILPDVLKALAIVGVVFIHQEVPWKAIFRYCVPAFIAISAFYMERGWARGGMDTARFWRRNFPVYAIPFVFWSLLYAVVSGGPLFFRNVPIHTLIGSQFGGFGFSGQYYFIILFQVILLFPFFRNALDSRTKVLGAIATGFLFDWAIVYGFSQHELLEKIGYRVVVYWIGYVALGIACARGYLKVRTLWPALAGCVVMALALVELRVLPDLCVYIAPSVTIGASLLIVTAFGQASLGAIAESRAGQAVLASVLYLGQNSFAVFVSNRLFLDLVHRSLPGWSAVPAIPVTIAILCGLGLGLVLERIGLGRLVGKR
ncbi:acyltransferase family protein [Novosphingobium nitrogenifigens]|nr:acyltransferase [Novosphingobium nitrogenifigens]